MERMEKDQRVGVLVNEFDKKGNRLPPKFFGRVDSVADNHKSGYVIMEERPEDDNLLPRGASDASSAPVHFHCSELVEA